MKIIFVIILHLATSRRKIFFGIIQQSRQAEVSYANLIRRLNYTQTTYVSHHCNPSLIHRVLKMRRGYKKDFSPLLQ